MGNSKELPPNGLRVGPLGTCNKPRQMVSRIAGKAIESPWSFLGTKEKEDAQPCFDYDGNSDGWLPVYLDGVQVMFRDHDKSTPKFYGEPTKPNS